MNEFPLVYCNGDSYSNEQIHSTLTGNVYANIVSEACNGFLINNSIAGSCNRRIIRSTVHDLIQQRQANPDQRIIALIGLTFDLRGEVWVDNLKTNSRPEESNLRAHTFSGQPNWHSRLLEGDDIETANEHKLDEKFYKKYSEGRAFFYSPYAERINLFCDLIMLRSLLEALNIDFLVFRASPVSETLEDEYLLDFFKKQLDTDQRFLDLDTFGFCSWAHNRGFVPLDFKKHGKYGHPSADAHHAFAQEILIPKLKI